MLGPAWRIAAKSGIPACIVRLETGRHPGRSTREPVPPALLRRPFGRSSASGGTEHGIVAFTSNTGVLALRLYPLAGLF